MIVERCDQKDKPKQVGIPTGFADLDSLLGGLRPGRVYVLAARPSMGKSALAGQIAWHAAHRWEIPTVFFSLEMDQEQVAGRLLAAIADIPNVRLRPDVTLTDEEYKRVTSAAIGSQNVPWWTVEANGITVSRLRARARQEYQGRGARLFVVDYLGLLDSSDVSRSGQSREREVSAQSAALKALAGELNVPVLVLSQLNREAEGRSDKRPLLSDLRESGSIEQDADVVMLLYRHGYYSRDTTDRSAELDVAKNRSGPTGKVRLSWDASRLRFTGWDPR
jgi:replicative DNA helicase